MTRALAFTSRAAIDIEEAYSWYEGQRAGLGADFQSELARIIQLLEAMPETGPVVHRDLRRLLVRRFPFALYYRLTESTVEVRGCLHQRRDPKTWIRRIKEQPR